MIEGAYLGMRLQISRLDRENRDYFSYCSQHDFRLQYCSSCDLVRYPPTSACPWCAREEAVWRPVEGRGTVVSYTEVTHAIQPAFKDRLPYLVLLVELDEQKGRPTDHEAVRMIGNLTGPDGVLAQPEMVARAGIGSRVRMTFSDVSPGISLPQWVLDAKDKGSPWRYPEKIA